MTKHSTRSRGLSPPGRARFTRRSRSTGGAQSFASLIDKAFAEEAVVLVNGERKTLTMQQCAIRRIVFDAAKGDMAAIKLLIQLKNIAKARGEAQPILIEYVKGHA